MAATLTKRELVVLMEADEHEGGWCYYYPKMTRDLCIKGALEIAESNFGRAYRITHAGRVMLEANSSQPLDTNPPQAQPDSPSGGTAEV